MSYLKHSRQLDILPVVNEFNRQNKSIWTHIQLSSILVTIPCILVALIAVCLVPNNAFFAKANEPIAQLVGIHPNAFQEGLQACAEISALSEHNAADVIYKNTANYNAARTRNPRVDVGGTVPPNRTLIEHATLWNGDGVIYNNTDILMSNGLIQAVGQNLASKISGDYARIDVHGRFVTPGIVDMHSHAGLDSWPGLNGNSDTNEDSPTRVPNQLRSLDAFNPWDDAIKIINSGGVTTSLILPGSRNAMGGEAYAFKYRHTPSNKSEDMLLNAGMDPNVDGKPWRWMKMACGENLRRTEGEAPADGSIYPSTRLGIGFLFRERFEKAKKLKEEQDDWCVVANKANAIYGEKANFAVAKRFPRQIELDNLVDLLRGSVLLNVHCYETYDLEMVVRLSHEFDFKIAAFHHALEAWQVSDMLAKEKIAVATFADHWGYKKEAYGESVHAAQLLSDKGVNVAFKSDHPVLNSQHLIFEAAKAHHYGLSAALAIQAVTSVPARLMGQENRLGHVLPGYDADVVIWHTNPLDIGSHPLKVFVDGISTFEHSLYKSLINAPFKPKPIYQTKNNVLHAQNIPRGNSTYTLENIQYALASKHTTENEAKKLNRIVVSSGIIKCAGDCAVEGVTIDVKGGWVTPGLIAAGVHLGLDEIEQEDVTKSGWIDTPSEYPITASGSLRVGRDKSKMLNNAFKAGVTTAISSLPFEGVVGGLPVAFRTGGNDSVNDVLPWSDIPQTFRLGNRVFKEKSIANSLDGQLQMLFKHALGSKAIIDVSDNNIIRRLSTVEGLKNQTILMGAEEAWMHAKYLKTFDILFHPARCTPSSWETQRCIEPSRVPSAYSILKSHGIRVGVSVNQDNFVRTLLWDAGWTVADLHEDLSGFEFAKESIALVTWNIAEMFGLQDRVSIKVGEKANFVVYDGVPGTLSANVVAVVDGTVVENDTEQL